MTEIEWDVADALPFPLCVSVEEQPGVVVGEAWGNIVLADHGRTIEDETSARCRRRRSTMPHAPGLRPVRAGRCRTRCPVAVPADARRVHRSRRRGALPERRRAGVRRSLAVDPATARPGGDARRHVSAPRTDEWTPVLDLLGSDGAPPSSSSRWSTTAPRRCASATRVHGRRPDDGTAFVATYRVGNGTVGNIGVDSIAHVATLGRQRARARQPAAGASAEPTPSRPDAVRRDAPQAFLVQQRAVTADDYARKTRAQPRGPAGGGDLPLDGLVAHGLRHGRPRRPGSPVDAAFEAEIRDHLEPFRMAGYDLEVDAPRFVPLEVGAARLRRARLLPRRTCARPCSTCSRAARAPSGTLGFFHPDRFTFGQPVYLSAIVAAAQAVAGRRVGDGDDASSASGTTPRARSTPASCRWGGWRSRGSTTTRASRTAAS